MQLLSSREQWATQLAETAQKPHANESSLRHALYTVLHPYAIDVVGLDESDIRHEGTSKSGRFDSLIGATLIEYKSPGELETKSKRRHHAGQALRYLRDEKIGANVVILTDGRTWGILRDPEVTDSGEQLSFDFAEPVQIPDDEYFQWRDNSPATAGRVLDLIDTIRFDSVTPQSLMNRLGPTTTQARAVLAQLSHALLEREKDSRTDILFNQWVALAGVSYGIDNRNTLWPEDPEEILGALTNSIPEMRYAETIYVLHTYIAICSKLMAAEALALSRSEADHRPSQWASLPRKELNYRVIQLEKGDLASEMRAPGLMGGDLFGWYATELDNRNDLGASLSTLFGEFAQLAWARLAHATRVTGDLLRDFYIGVVPRKMRKALGEFFTPQWIAERVVTKAVKLSNHDSLERIRFLDPTCGSGTFLVAALQRSIASATARGLSEEACAREAIECVTGFDINPVSPLMARVNLLLGLGDLADYLPEIRFNVFQADSILIPESPSGAVTFEHIDAALTVPLVIGDIALPAALATIPAIAKLTQVLERSVEQRRSDHIFMERLKSDFPEMGVPLDQYSTALSAATALFVRLKKLASDRKDGIWAHVIEQSFAPKILEPVDIVVGNPPWISWKHLPEVWRSRSEPTWRQWGLWQTKRAGGGTPMADISSLLLARCVATYCPEGIVALLLPEGILLNEPGGRAIRRTRLVAVDGSDVQRFDPLFVDDFSTLKPFPDAANKPIALYVGSGSVANFPVDGLRWTRARSRAALPVDAPLSQVEKILDRSHMELAPVDPRDVASKWRPLAESGELPRSESRQVKSYVWGQGFHTRGADGIFYCQVLSQKPTADGLVRIKTRPDLGRNTRRSVKPGEYTVESKFLWPLLRGANVEPFSIIPSGLYCIVPHDPTSWSTVLSVSRMLSEGPRLFDYLEEHMDRLLNRSAYDLKIDGDHPWGIQGTSWSHISRASYLVVCRYMHSLSRPPAAVCRPKENEQLGLTTTYYPNNKVNFVACHSLSAADYLCAFTNSDPAQRMISRYSSTTTISPSTMNSLGIPVFDSSNPRHRDLAAVGQECRLQPKAWEPIISDANRLVFELLEDA